MMPLVQRQECSAGYTFAQEPSHRTSCTRLVWMRELLNTDLRPQVRAHAGESCTAAGALRGLCERVASFLSCKLSARNTPGKTGMTSVESSAVAARSHLAIGVTLRRRVHRIAGFTAGLLRTRTAPSPQRPHLRDGGRTVGDIARRQQHSAIERAECRTLLGHRRKSRSAPSSWQRHVRSVWELRSSHDCGLVVACGSWPAGAAYIPR